MAKKNKKPIVPKTNIIMSFHFVKRFNERFNIKNQIIDIAEYLNRTIPEGLLCKDGEPYYGLVLPNARAYIPMSLDTDGVSYIAKTIKGVIVYDRGYKNIKLNWVMKGNKGSE